MGVHFNTREESVLVYPQGGLHSKYREDSPPNILMPLVHSVGARRRRAPPPRAPSGRVDWAGEATYSERVLFPLTMYERVRVLCS